MATKALAPKNTATSPVGKTTAQAASSRARRSRAYRDARAEYARISELRKVHPIAAHLRERRLELGLTQDEVAKAAGTTDTAISRMEKGVVMPKLATLQRIAEVLDEELLLCFRRSHGDEVEQEFAAVA